MRKVLKSKLPAVLLGIGLAVLCGPAVPDDIDLFVNAQAATATNPNILFIIDNTANWSRQAEHFPSFTYNGQSGSTQGAAEAAAIASALSGLSSAQLAKINVGLMEFTNKQQAGGQIGFAVQQMTSTNMTSFLNTLVNTPAAIFNNINSPSYKIAQTTPYGALMADAYNYFTGNAPVFYYNPPPNVPLDVNGYTDNTYAKFKAPGGSGCNHNYIIFLGNPPARGPISDDGSNTDPGNTSLLAGLGGSTAQPPVSQFAVGNVYSNLGSSAMCYSANAAGVSSCTNNEPTLTPGYASQCSNFLSCQCSSTSSTALPTCSSLGYAANTARYSVFGTGSSTTSSNGPTTNTVTANADTNSQTACTNDTSSTSSTTPTNTTTNGADTGTQTSCTTDTSANSTPSNNTTNNVNTGTITACTADTPTTTTISTHYACSKNDPGPPASPACPAGDTCADFNTGTSCGGSKTYWNYQATSYAPNPLASPSCPAQSGPTTTGTNPTTTTTTTWASCTDPSSGASTTGCGAHQHNFQIFGNKTVSTYTTTYTPAPVASPACPAQSGPTTTGTNPTTTTTTTWASCTDPASGATNTGCGTNQHKFEILGNKTVSTYTTTTTYTPNPPASPACPATSTSTSAPVSGPGANQTQTTTTTTSWASCTDPTSGASTTSCGTNQHKFEIFGTETQSQYTTTNTTTTATTTLGNTVACYTSGTCSTSDYSGQAGNYNGGLSCGVPTTQTGTCPSGQVTYQVQGVFQGESPTGTTGLLSPLPMNANLWAQFMRERGVANTYSIDVYNAAPDPTQSALLNSMAQLGGGKYYAAQNEQAIANAISGILQEIQSVNETFASAALPVNATNRTQNQNEVFIGQFRPDPNDNPRWFGNLKRYQIIIGASGGTDLGDANSKEAVNTQTGFLADCATSYWTSSGVSNYWLNVADDNPSPGGVCSPNSATNPFFGDDPDGPIVEKGAVSEVLRLGNGNGATTNPATTRNMLTLSSAGAVVPLTAASAPTLSTQALNFTLGQDVYGEASGGSPVNPSPASTAPRPSIHGDVIHSRPLAVNVGGSVADVVFYGDNDGPYRAVNATNGQELWSFIAPEHISKLNRQMTDSPAVSYYPTEPTTKDYFFDGSTGLYESSSNSRIWIYPSMRRGGRKVYAFDVSSPTSIPSLLWSAGCPDLSDDTGCTTDSNGVSMSGIGQTWSLPNAAFIKGYTASGGNNPDSTVVVMGGGYDACEDPNTASPSCGTPKGNVVYVLDGHDGHVVAQFPTTRSVAADVALVDVDGDGNVDFAYAADTGGNIYRINFVNPSTLASLPPPGPGLTGSATWGITRIAYMDPTIIAGRKFLFGPAVLPAPGGTVYLALGSGDREHPLITEYPVTPTPVQNRFYVYLDSLTSNSATDLDTDTSISNATGATCNSPAVVLPGQTPKGWYLNLPGTGEETVSSALILEGQVAFSTNTPTSPAAGQCTSLGTAQGYLVSLFNGSGAIGVTGTCGGRVASTFQGGALPPSPVLAVVPITTATGTVTKIVTIGVVQKGGGLSSPYQAGDWTQAVTGPRKGVFWKKTGDN